MDEEFLITPRTNFIRREALSVPLDEGAPRLLNCLLRQIGDCGLLKKTVHTNVSDFTEKEGHLWRYRLKER